MPVVSNTSPVLNLAIIGRIDLLHSQFGEVMIPPGVRDELRPETALPGTAAIKQAIELGWLQVRPLKETRMVEVLTRNLDRGEAEAISLALEQGMSAILLDESEGRATAKSLGLEPVGILGIILKAKKRGEVASVGETMKALQVQAGFFINQSLYAQILALAGE